MDEDSGRNYSAEMSKIITEILLDAEADLIPSVASWTLVSRLKKTDPELLTGWLLEHSSTFLAEQIKHRLASARARARSNAARSAFAADARKFTGGDSSAISHWKTVRYAVDGENTQRRLLDMNRDDLNFAAARYSRSAHTALLEEAFLLALASRVGQQTVGAVFTENDIDRMYSSIQGRTSIVAS